MSWSNSRGDTVATEIGDTFTGSDTVDDLANGLGGDDVINGFAGLDTLEGSDGSDVIYGGDDDDLVTDSADGGNLHGEDGNDTILATLEGALGPNAAWAFGGDGDDLISVTGGGLDDGTGTPFGISALGDAGNDTIVTGTSADFIGGGGDNDSIDAGDGSDDAYGDDGNDTIDGGGGDDRLYGDDGFASFLGNDSIAGGEGDDTIFGEDGDDTLSGGAGVDSLIGGAGTNALDFSDATTGVEMVMGQGDIFNDGFGNQETIDGASFTVAYGSSHGDRFFAGSGANDSLFGQAGEDNLLGGSGDDTLSGGTENDRVIGEEGSDLVLGEDGDDTLIGGRADLTTFEPEAEGADTFDNAGTTIGYGDTLDGGAGQDLLLGMEGDDSLSGGISTDTLDGGTGNDIIDGGDSVEFGDEGNTIGVIRESDVITFTAATAGVSFSLTDGSSGAVSDGAGGIDTLTNIEQVIGTSFNDSMEMFWSAPETIDILMAGGGGNDRISLVGDAAATLDGGAGNDTIFGGDANDTILGGEGNDLVFGGDGNDSILATPGNDTVEGGIGDDTIDTGDGDDLVIWRAGDGDDSIAMGGGTDTLFLEGWTGGTGDNWNETISGGTRIFEDTTTGALLTTTGVETVVCFAAGTRILTPRGEVPVETLRAGDLVVAPGGGAPFKPLRWVGHTHIDIARHRAPEKVAPILLRAGALAAGVPARDLRVSPEHAFLLGGRLVPARLLVNGTTIIQEVWQRRVSYWHVELDSHGILVAEGALTESYFDDGNRHFFDNAVVALYADFDAGRQGGRYATQACAPPLLSADDPALPGIRAALPAVQPAARRA